MKNWFLIISFTLWLGACAPKEDNLSHYKYNDVLPLSVGTSWQYSVTRYDGYNTEDYMTASSTIKDTVVHSGAKEGYWVASVKSEKSAEILVEIHGNYPVTDSLQPASKLNYCLIMDGNRILRQETSLNIPDLQAQVQVEFTFPLQVGKKWSIGNAKDAPLNREVKKQGAITVR